MEKFKNLPGMRDLSQESWMSQKAAQDYLREFFSLHGYQVLETPVLEPTELYLRKSGGELAARMYTFTDPGGNQVSLRPEYTASIVRHYLDEGFPDNLPLRVQYAGPVFRYEGEDSSYRQFIQVGAELFGSSSPRADAEILSLSCIALSGLGLGGHRLEIGDLEVMRAILEALGLSDRATVFILGSLSDLKDGQEGLTRVQERAKQLRLLETESQQDHIATVIGTMGEAEARELLQGLLQWSEVGALGQREPSEVVDRLLRKFRVTDDAARLQRGLEVASRLGMVRGEPESCLKEVTDLIKSWELSASVLDGLKEVMQLLDADQLQGADVVLDFGLVRGIAYYTGIVFEIRHASTEAPLVGGGRYDGLATALGSPVNVPALGFAFSLEHVLEALDAAGVARDGHVAGAKRVLVLAPNEKGYKDALRLAHQLQEEGTTTEMEVCGMSVEESLSYARANGIGEVIAIDGQGQSTTYSV